MAAHLLCAESWPACKVMWAGLICHPTIRLPSETGARLIVRIRLVDYFELAPSSAMVSIAMAECEMAPPARISAATQIASIIS
jgi:hypothetical protein